MPETRGINHIDVLSIVAIFGMHILVLLEYLFIYLFIVNCEGSSGVQ